MDDEYEYGIPPELREWFESKRNEELELSKPRYYILRDLKLVQVGLLEWAMWLENMQNSIDHTTIGETNVSTVFLGIDYNFCFTDLPNHRPILFESMIFGGPLDQFQWRYSTLGEAKQGHAELVAAVREDRQPFMTWGQEGFWNLFRDMFE